MNLRSLQTRKRRRFARKTALKGETPGGPFGCPGALSGPVPEGPGSQNVE